MKTTRMEGVAIQSQNMAMNLEFWQYIFDAIDDPVFLHDTQFRVLLANHAYCREAGMTKVEAIGKYYWEVFPLGSGPLPGCMDAVSGKSCTSVQDEVRVGEKCFLSNSYVIRDGQGQLLYSLHLLHDITAQRQAVSVSMRDSGIGMAPEELAMAFQPLFTSIRQSNVSWSEQCKPPLAYVQSVIK